MEGGCGGVPPRQLEVGGGGELDLLVLVMDRLLESLSMLRIRGSTAAVHYSAPPGGRRWLAAAEGANKLVEFGSCVTPSRTPGIYRIFF